LSGKTAALVLGYASWTAAPLLPNGGKRMPVHEKVCLKPVPAPALGAGFVDAPPVLNASNHTTDYSCGTCGTVLMHAEVNQVFGLTIRCKNCGSFSATEA
jgi:DNA-directed RNA polymerase subunit RPC12/RpoP